MKFTGKFVGIKLDRQAYLVFLQEYLQKKLFEVTNVWLNAATGRVPVWSGMAKGSLLVLANLVDSTLLITPRRGIKSKIALGEIMGTAIPDWETPGRALITISTEVPHYVLQEFQNVGVSKSAPWLSFEAGAAAYKVAVQTVKLPAPFYKSVNIKAI